MPAIGPYEIERELGRGATSRVLLGRHKTSGALRAVKVLEVESDPEAVARFRREVEILARVGPEGVVPLHDSGAESGRFWLAMAVMPGGSLKERLKARGALPWREAVSLVARLARTLARAHALGLVHRDVKPENVLFDERGEPRLADFGYARDRRGTPLTNSGDTFGTPLYMAPEQIEAKNVDGRADVFSLGCVLYELVTGVRPHEGRALPEILYAALLSKRAPIEERAAAPEALQALIDRALAPRPEHRPDAATLAVELDALLGDEKPAPVPWRALAAAGGALVLAVVLAVALARRAPAPLTAPERAPPSPSLVDQRLNVLLERANAAIQSSNALLEDLESAIATARDPLPLRAARTHALARWGAALQASDLAALATASDAEKLARHVEASGLVGSDGEVAALVAAWRAATGERAAVAAFEELRLGRCTDRARSEQALGVSSWRVAQRAARALRAADYVKRSVAKEVLDPVGPRDVRELAASLRPAAEELGPRGLVAVVAPITSGLRNAVRPPDQRSLREAAWHRIEETGLDGLEAGPLLVALVMLSIVHDEEKANKLGAALLTPISLATLDEADPLIALCARSELARQIQMQGVVLHWPEALEVLGPAEALYARARVTSDTTEHIAAGFAYLDALLMRLGLERAAVIHGPPEDRSAHRDAELAVFDATTRLLEKLADDDELDEPRRVAAGRAQASALTELWSEPRADDLVARAERDPLTIWLVAQSAIAAHVDVATIERFVARAKNAGAVEDERRADLEDLRARVESWLAAPEKR